VELTSPLMHAFDHPLSNDSSFTFWYFVDCYWWPRVQS